MSAPGNPDHCPTCRALFGDCGPVLWLMYSRKLLIRGWPGQVNRVEQRYIRAHVSEAERRKRQRAAERMRLIRHQPRRTQSTARVA